MLELLDGPCKSTFLVKRAPQFLRAVINKKGVTDVLDQVDDTPEVGETVYVYRLEGGASWVHIKGARGISGFYAMAKYHYLPDVDGQSLRDNVTWRKWCVDRLLKEDPLPGDAGLQ